MSQTIPLTPTLTSAQSLEDAIYETLAYSDVFDYPLTLQELHKYLVLPATMEDIESCLGKIDQVTFRDGYYFLSGRDVVVKTRQIREERSRPVFKRAFFYGKVIGTFPFVKMTALTGSLAMLNLSNEIDLDFMLITRSNRLWLARALAVTFGRFIRLLGDRICINLLVSEGHLHWDSHDLYSAREICQMLPVSGFDMYSKLRVVNKWTQDFCPNEIFQKSNTAESKSFLQTIFELPFLGKLGDWIEDQVMKIQLKLISKNFEMGEETNFTADICQGNFHDHKRWTMRAYQERVRAHYLSSSTANSTI